MYNSLRTSTILTRRLPAWAVIISVLMIWPAALRAQSTYVWADNAQGQAYLYCPNCGFSDCNSYWPSNNLWTQTYQTNQGCNRQGTVESEPSNWNPYTTNDPALGVGVYPGGPGGEGLSVVLGAPANTYLNANAYIDQLTILPSGQLTLGGGTLTVLSAVIEGDGALVQAGNDLISVPQNGVFEKVAGTNTYTVQPAVLFNNAFAISSSGTLVLNGQNGTPSLNGSFETWPGCVIDLTGGSSSLWSGTMTGLNAFGALSAADCGQVQLNSGSIDSESGELVTLNFPTNHLWWNGGSLSGTFDNTGGIIVDSAGGPTLGGTLYNDGSIYETNAGQLNDGIFFNDANGIFKFVGDGSIGSGMTFVNSGLVEKSEGASNSTINNVQGEGGTFKVDTGTLTLAGDNLSSNGIFSVASGTVLDLTGGSRPTWAGAMSGSGGGTVLLADGRLYSAESGLTLAFAPNTFLWTGGQIWGGGGPVTNNMSIQIAASNAPGLAYCGFYNNDAIIQTNGGNFDVGQYAFVNEPQAHYFFAGDGGSLSGGLFINYGLIDKTSGTGSSTITCQLDNLGGTIEADSGTLALASGGTSSNATFIPELNAVIDLTGGNNGATWTGTLTGSGDGRVLLTNGVFSFPSNGLNLNFPPGLFWWMGGAIEAEQTGAPYTNIGSITISPANAPANAYGAFYNFGIIHETNAGNFNVGAIALVNQAGGVYDFDGNGGIVGNQFLNYGLLDKKFGAGISTINCQFINLGGTIEADSGTLALANGGLSSNATFVAGPNAVIDLTGGNNSGAWTGTLTGSGQGEITLASGSITFPSNGLNLNFAPGLFLWTGGGIYAEQTGAGYTNFGSITISPVNAPANAYGTLFNNSIIHQTNTGNFNVGAISLVNQLGGIYEFDGDGGITGNQFVNYGLLKKRCGTNVSAMNNSQTINYGGIEVDSGAISVPGGFSMGGGNLTVALGGDGPGQVGRLAVQGSVALSGGLQVVLTNGFFPAVSNTYQIVSCSSLSGTFTNFSLPKGLSLAYSNSGVYVVVGTLPVTIQSPSLTNGAFSFGFQTQSNQSYLIQEATNLAPALWSPYSNFSGSGAWMQFTVPTTNLLQQYFRVSEPTNGSGN